MMLSLLHLNIDHAILCHTDFRLDGWSLACHIDPDLDIIHFSSLSVRNPPNLFWSFIRYMIGEITLSDLVEAEPCAYRDRLCTILSRNIRLDCCSRVHRTDPDIDRIIKINSVHVTHQTYFITSYCVSFIRHIIGEITPSHLDDAEPCASQYKSCHIMPYRL